MTWALDAMLRTSIVLAAGLGVAAVLRRRRAALRHAVLAGAVFGSAIVPGARLLPALIVTVPSVAAVSPAVPASAHVSDGVIAGAPKTGSDTTPGARISSWALAWFAGFLVMAASLGADVARVRRIAANAEPLDDVRWRRCADDLRRAFGIRRGVTLLLTTTNDVLATAGAVHPRVFLPADVRSWSDDRIRIVLAHELAHIRRGDWAIQIGAEIVRAVCWFNPLVWMTCTRLRRESEHACDDVVVASGVQPSDYAAHLLDIARASRRPLRISTAVPIGRPPTLHRRIAVMLNNRIDHRPAAPRRGLWIAALGFAAVISVVAIQAKQAGPAPLSGTIYDPTGAVLPGVNVTLDDVNGVAQKTRSDSAGRFEFPVVAPGRYRIVTSVPGFRTLDTRFDLKAPQDWDRPITLQVGDLQETITVRADRFGGSAPAAAPGGQPVRVGGEIKPPTKVFDVRPVYPPEMRATGREGAVPLEATIRVDGSVGSVRVLSAEVHPDFAIAAVDAVRQWRFTPTLLNGKPVEVVMNVSITFKLAD